jgi:predicted transcriptional regulator
MVPSEFLIDLTAGIIAAHTQNTTIAAAELPTLIRTVYATLANLGHVAAPEDETLEPAVSVRSSVKADAIACLECGLKFKTLKRHLSSGHGLTPLAYRARWNLKSDYPMIAPRYAAVRSKLASDMGLGRKPAAKAPVAKRARKASAKA